MILDVQFQEQEAVLKLEIDKVITDPASVVYNREQALTPEQQAQARANIGAVTLKEVLDAIPNGEEVAY